MRKVLHCSRWVPEWLIRAAGFQPEWFVSGYPVPIGPAPDSEGVCPFARMFVNHGCARDDVAAVIFTTDCDQMRRSVEWIAPDSATRFFLMNVPATVTGHAQELYVSEAERLLSFLTAELGGDRLSVALFRKCLGEVSAGNVCDRSVLSASCAGVPVALIGGHTCIPSEELVRLLSKNGAEVVFNWLSRNDGLGMNVDGASASDVSSLLRLNAGRQFESIRDISQRPNERFHRQLRQDLAESSPRGVVLVRQLWCDRWHLEMLRLRKSLGIPLLDLELNGPFVDATARCRIQAFVESLSR